MMNNITIIRDNIIWTSARDGCCTLYGSFLLVVSVYLCMCRRFHSYDNYYYNIIYKPEYTIYNTRASDNET